MTKRKLGSMRGSVLQDLDSWITDPTDLERGMVLAALYDVGDACNDLRECSPEASVNEETLRRECADEIEALIAELHCKIRQASAPEGK